MGEGRRVELIRSAMLLLNELAYAGVLGQQLSGGSWRADLLSVTALLLRAKETQPRLRGLGLPARLLQTALQQTGRPAAGAAAAGAM